MLDARFLDDLKNRLTLSDVVGRKVKLMRAGREYQGLCPFHNEKTPSFTVNDQKGFYHCFGCGAHGSVIDFVMETEGLEFREAIEVLAAEAGVDVPKVSREAAKKAEARKSLSEVMEVVTDWYQAQLMSGAGREALAYLRRRGLSDEGIHRYRLGYAPDGRTTLKEAMRARGIPLEDLVETGMLIDPDDGPKREPYDRFRDRVMFPITDRQGRMIAFGGRTLAKDAKAKYLNSPETTLFHKGATLYNWATAREAAYTSGQVIVVEGYMDVIALGEAGVDHAVAPLGTALTEEQITHLWQMADEPILMFDGDKAGMRAAGRAAERALPMLKPGKSLRFVFIPDGEDPDDLVRREGRQAIDALVDGAAPLSGFLWRTLTEGVPADTPERRAGLEKNLFGTLSVIVDEGVKALYQKDYRDRLWQHFRKPRQNFLEGKAKGGRPWQPASVLQRDKTGLLGATALGSAAGEAGNQVRAERMLMLTLAHHPEILLRHEEEIAGFDFTVPGLADLRNVLLEMHSGDVPLDPDVVMSHLEGSDLAPTLAKLKADLPRKAYWPAWPEAALSDALTFFEHALARYRFALAKAEYARAEADLAADMTDENYQRFLAAQAAYREMEDKQASIDGFGLESNKAYDA